MRSIKSKCCLFLIAAIIVSCSSNPYSRTNRIHKQQAKQYAKQLSSFPPEHEQDEIAIYFGKNQAGTTNFNLRKPNFVIIHHTAQESVEQTLQTFTIPKTQVSSHYVISKEGEIYQMLNDYYRAWHGGVGKWGNTTDLNSASIGIELDNNGYEEFSLLQIHSLLELLKVLKERHNIPTANFIGHSDIAPARKVDPNPAFPWKRLAEEGFGHWYDETIIPPYMLTKSSMAGDEQIDQMDTSAIAAETGSSSSAKDTTTVNIDAEMALRIIGYDTSDLDAAIKAFKLHFIQTEVNAVLTDQDLKILNNLYRKYM